MRVNVSLLANYSSRRSRPDRRRPSRKRSDPWDATNRRAIGGTSDTSRPPFETPQAPGARGLVHGRDGTAIARAAKSFAGLCLGIRLEFRLHPFARACFDLVRRSRRGVSPQPVRGPRHIVGKLRDVSDWAKTDLHLDMPADNGRFRLVPYCKEVDLGEPMLDAPGRAHA
jgi:hypothetical protein